MLIQSPITGTPKCSFLWWLSVRMDTMMCKMAGLGLDLWVAGLDMCVDTHPKPIQDQVLDSSLYPFYHWPFYDPARDDLVFPLVGIWVNMLEEVIPSCPHHTVSRAGQALYSMVACSLSTRYNKSILMEDILLRIRSFFTFENMLRSWYHTLYINKRESLPQVSLGGIYTESPAVLSTC